MFMVLQKGRFWLFVGLLLVVAFVGGTYFFDNETVVSESTFPPPPEIVGDHFALAEYYFNQDSNPDGPYDTDQARLYYQMAVEENPRDNSELWYQYGRLEFVAGNMWTAIDHFNSQIKYHGDTLPNVHYMLGLAYGYLALYEEHDPDHHLWRRAEQAFLTYLEYAPTSPWPRVDLAWVYFSQGKYTEMLPILEEGLKHESDNAWLLNTYGLALLNTDQKDLARQQFLSAKTIAAQLTTADWSRSYPGNDPGEWGAGLEEFRAVIDSNLTLSE